MRHARARHRRRRHRRAHPRRALRNDPARCEAGDRSDRLEEAFAGSRVALDARHERREARAGELLMEENGGGNTESIRSRAGKERRRDQSIAVIR